MDYKENCRDPRRSDRNHQVSLNRAREQLKKFMQVLHCVEMLWLAGIEVVIMQSDRTKRTEELRTILQGLAVSAKYAQWLEMIAQCQSRDRKTSRIAFNRLIQAYQDRVYTTYFRWSRMNKLRLIGPRRFCGCYRKIYNFAVMSRSSLAAQNC